MELQQSYAVPAANIHAIRQKLQHLIALAEGDNTATLVRCCKDIDGLLPRAVWTPAPKQVTI